ncbi:tetratricopeptide repeat protein [Sulfuricurvum sp. IAE1]|uniref:tetratricopeptide repeat protein n=1 Tax=Sulfuricurvum sp. IAE1 TaxID=2546102 RepID=UPI0010526DE6|nr:tetratricopeptide repeat protein [Sulfuricurvum sp. IAE1]TDA69189.1 tetratricopeptide repeat protein [Sulfuricurvum sp. IAE1]
MRTSVAFLTLFSLSLSASEPSVFGAGNLNAPNPYGLTNEEKLILENKKEIQTVLQKHNVQNAKVETVTERLDGLQTIVEGLAQATNEHRQKLQRLGDDNASQSVSELKKQVDANTENIAQFKSLLEELSLVVDGINADYVTKEQFAQLISQLKLKPIAAKNGETPAKMSATAIEKEAFRLFGEKKYAEAQSMFEQMVQKKHKTAEAHYMIGECLYERKAYKEAVASYKESASRNEKALYMPTLLLHSGISMEKTGDHAMAKAFYQATISKYAGSGAAREAQERISKLK